MPLDVIPLPPFPNVPPFPGVPALPVAPGTPSFVTPPPLLSGDDPALSSALPAPVWGIYDASGQTPVIEGDCTYRFAEVQEYRVSDYPVEQGGFASYNKVTVPNELHITINKGGSVSDRQQFRSSIVQAAASLDMLTVITPEATYINMTIHRYSFERSNEHGANMLSVDIMVREVRQAPDAAFSNTASPNGKAQTNGGTVAAQSPTTAQTAATQSGAS